MKQEMNCDIIRDLLPLYLDDLASEATAAVVKEHLETCEDCRAFYDDMKKPLPVEADDSKVVDGLKRIRRSLKMRALIILALFVMIVGALFKVYVWGSQIGWQGADIQQWVYNDEDSTVTIMGHMEGTRAISRYTLKTDRDNDTILLRVYAAPISPLHPNRDFSITIPVEADFEIIWQDTRGDEYKNGRPYTISPTQFGAYIFIPGEMGGSTADRTHILSIQRIIDNASDTDILQEDEPRGADQINIHIDNANVVSLAWEPQESEIQQYVYEQDGRYYLEELKWFYGAPFEEIVEIDGEMKTGTTRHLEYSIANRKFVREITSADYAALLRIIEEVDAVSGWY